MFISFVIKYWRVILLAALVAMAGYYKMRYEAVKSDLEAYKLTAKVLYDDAVKQNAIIKENSDKAIAGIVENHNGIVSKLNLDRDKLAKELQREILLNGNRLNAYADRMLLDNSNRSTTTETSSYTKGTAEAEWERDRAYIATLERAGASCAADFNLARGWIDSVCSNYECRKN